MPMKKSLISNNNDQPDNYRTLKKTIPTRTK